MQLIDASHWFKPLPKNLGKKNCELSPEDIQRISQTFLDFQGTPENPAFGYWKVTVERPLRLRSQLTLKVIETLRFTLGDEAIRDIAEDKGGEINCRRLAWWLRKHEGRIAAGLRFERGDSNRGRESWSAAPVTPVTPVISSPPTEFVTARSSSLAGDDDLVEMVI